MTLGAALYRRTVGRWVATAPAACADHHRAAWTWPVPGSAQNPSAVVKSTAATAEQPSIMAVAKASTLVAAFSDASTAQAHSWAAGAEAREQTGFVTELRAHGLRMGARARRLHV